MSDRVIIPRNFPFSDATGNTLTLFFCMMPHAVFMEISAETGLISTMFRSQTCVLTECTKSGTFTLKYLSTNAVSRLIFPILTGFAGTPSLFLSSA
jgi:hypothetical protein